MLEVDDSQNWADLNMNNLIQYSIPTEEFLNALDTSAGALPITFGTRVAV